MQHKITPLHLERIQIKNFRCFQEITFNLDSPVVLIEGANGSGKTSILESLYYACYLRSFRTHLPRELLQFNHANFFIKAWIANDSFTHEIQVGFSGAKRLVKVDQKSISSYKELMDYYRIVSLTEDDLELVKGGPQARRTFIDQAIVLHDPAFAQQLRKLKQVIENRNGLLRQGRIDREMYLVLTEQLWDVSRLIQQQRQGMLASLIDQTNLIIHDFFDQEVSIILKYQPKKMPLEQGLADFMQHSDGLYKDEQRMGRTLFGAHLDDISMVFDGKTSRSFASRGQQKLLVLMLKIAQIKHLNVTKGPAIFLLDDFMTDFDESRAQMLLSIMGKLESQLIFTSPAHSGFLAEHLKGFGLHHIKLTHRI